MTSSDVRDRLFVTEARQRLFHLFGRVVEVRQTGSRPGRVRQIAPAGTSDSSPFHSNATQPLVTRSRPDPSSSVFSVYSQPRSTAVPEAVSTKKSLGGAEILAWIWPRSSASLCSPGRAVTTRSRVFGATSTEPIDPTSYHSG